MICLACTWVVHGVASANVGDMEEQRVFVFGEGLTLRGLRPSAEGVVQLPALAQRSTPAVLHLRLHASDLLDRSRSTLTVAVNDEPLETLRLDSAPLRSGRLEVSLGELPKGFHRVQVLAHLVVPGDPCLNELERETWLRIDGESHVRFTQVAVKPPAPSLVAIGKALRTDEGGQVALYHPDATEPEVAEAVLLSDHWLRDLGDSPGRPSTAAIVLSHVSAPEPAFAYPGLAERLAREPALRAVAALAGHELHVLGRDASGLRDMVAMLMDDRARARCQATTCALTHYAPVDRPSVAPPDPADATVVSTLGQAGFAEGWQASGAGSHRLTWHWERPASFRVRAVPRLDLSLRGPQAGPLDQRLSHLQVRLNGTPIADYSLEALGAGPETLRVGIPREFWQAQSWHFQVTTRLRTADETPCGRVDQGRVWLVIGPDSALHVPRDEQRVRGLADLRQHAHRDGFAWRFQLLRRPGLRALGAVTHALRGPRTPPMRVVATAAECAPTCVQVRLADRTDSPLDRVNELSAGPSAVGAALGLPVQSERVMLLERPLVDGDEPDTPRQLVLWLFDEGPDDGISDGPLLAPDYGTLAQRAALYARGRWAPVEGLATTALEMRQVRFAAPPSVPEPRTSEQERHWLQLNLFWLGACLVSLVGLPWGFRRLRRRFQREAGDQAHA